MTFLEKWLTTIFLAPAVYIEFWYFMLAVITVLGRLSLFAAESYLVVAPALLTSFFGLSYRLMLRIDGTVSSGLSSKLMRRRDLTEV